MADTGYRGSPWLLKGSFIQLKMGLLGITPNVVVFQYNPETISRGFQAWEPTEDEKVKLPALTSQTAQPFDLEETFDMDIELDATDALADDNTPARAYGIADRIAALKQLMVPETNTALVKVKADGLGGAAAKAKNAPGNAKTKTMHRATIAPVLFAWGPGRIVPVRLTSLNVEESQFTQTLYPTQATVSISIAVLTPAKLANSDSIAFKLARTAYKAQQYQDKTLAALNLLNPGRSALPWF